MRTTKARTTKVKAGLVVALLTLCGAPGGAPRAYAWNDGGHMLVAQIAMNRLAKLDPAAWAQVNAILKDLPNPAHPAVPYTAVTVACWMDDVRKTEFDEPSWHYVDVPCGGKVEKAEKPNALTAIEKCVAVLRQPATTTAARRERALARLIHVVGDVHQPLHCLEELKGGNLFPIAGIPDLFLALDRDGRDTRDSGQPGVYQKLHAYWDGAYRYDRVGNAIQKVYDLGRSDSPDTAKTQYYADLIYRDFLPKDAAELAKTDPKIWVADSSKKACDFALRLQPKKTPSPAYIHSAHDIACTRIALAGYRLAALLDALLA